ncbi:MAG: hypothetical protein ACXWAC_17240, partial [Usitatibacter sp.]
FLVHRLSGLALTLFLPAHFLALGTAIRGEGELDEFLRWTDQPLVIAAEWVLVMLLAAHLAGGLRLLALELLPWREWQKALAAGGAFFAILAGLVFALAR